MPQNIYDNPEFFEGYAKLRASAVNANDTMMRPYMRQLIGDVRGLDVLDIGCGTGEMCRWMVETSAASVTGMDVSTLMLEQARSLGETGITYIHTSAEDASFEPDSFNLVTSTLMLHYLKDVKPLFEKVHSWLRRGGRYVFSMEHPVMTAGQGIVEPGWLEDPETGRRVWTVLRYSDESERISRWFVDGVVRYHRKTATIVNSLIDAGFRIERMLEPHAPEELEAKHSQLMQERERPLFLFMSAEAVK